MTLDANVKSSASPLESAALKSAPARPGRQDRLMKLGKKELPMNNATDTLTARAGTAAHPVVPDDRWTVCVNGPTVADSEKIPCSEKHNWRAVVKQVDPEAERRIAGYVQAAARLRHDAGGLVAVDLDAADPDVMYLGTGEASAGLVGVGAFKSLDSGNTWALLGATSVDANADWRFVNRLAIHPLQPQETVQGALQVINELAVWLIELTGMHGVASDELRPLCCVDQIGCRAWGVAGNVQRD